MESSVSSSVAMAVEPGPHATGEEMLAVFWHEGMLAHDAGCGVYGRDIDPGFLDVLDQHPENADRVRNMVSILRRGPIARFLSWYSGRPAHAAELLSFHSAV
ncbi:hypothetical protein E2562_003666 [Oryza meyeriana var. granulata]|uniref:Histone deacetylase n=1 Tax=Oryza meyeriana var. granulata TaxID=110450 RepID=A0A6G1C3P0_9ORYZ|nr:hypothetical protein E2562_003666 [Oryza meyeriana var. granulata]